MKQFIKKYTLYKNNYIIKEGTINTLRPTIEQDVLDHVCGGLTYQLLNTAKKEQFERLVNSNLSFFKSKIEDVTENKQYQSWLYDVISKTDFNNKQYNWDNDDWNFIKNIIQKFSKIIKSSMVNKAHPSSVGKNWIQALTASKCN